MQALFLQTLNVTAPVFAMVFLGVVFRRLGWIDAAFIQSASNLVFRVGLPAMLFISLIRADLGLALQPALLGYFSLMTVLSFLLVWGWAIWRCPRAERGVFVQGSFRGNCGIVGLALAVSLYGDYGWSVGGVLAGLVILFYNVLSAVVLAIYSDSVRSDWRSILSSVARNPMILAVLAAMPFAYFGIVLPKWLVTSGEYLAQTSLPLALLCIGGSLSLAALRSTSGLAISASLFKILWLPLLATAGAVAVGFDGRELGILFLYFASPTAAASYVMARAVNSNHELAANIIVISTVLAVVSVNAGLFILHGMGWLSAT